MLLSPSGAEDYDLTIKTTPQLTAWEASFDDGATWHAASTDVADNTHYYWNVKGPLCTDVGAAAAFLVAIGIQPLVRSIQAPHVYVRKAPYISLSTPTSD
jgi:hypothetical protein